MGYRVEYETVRKVRRMEQKTARLPAMIGAALVLFLILVGIFWPEGKETLRNFLIPGDPAVTVAALEELAEELETGAPLGEALDNFCRSIVREDGLGPA